MMTLNVLNIPVDDALLAAWCGWLAPARQPFYLTGAEADALEIETVPRDGLTLTPEERDTVTEWNIARLADRVAWLTLSDVEPCRPRPAGRCCARRCATGGGTSRWAAPSRSWACRRGVSCGARRG
ncbi:hypothetical protein [Deinococcus xianganensis]|uniref:hypothetical protein n=1 Tax=Deinococcus xianganensis TaxID=1507289 RepID=UPI001F25D64C|nr:hypothetical protein [Deinococcus xianganensis]